MIGDKRGVTLMELLVVMGVFSLTVTITSAVFLQSNAAQRRVLALTAAQADIRFALEAMVREVRSGRIDYETYAASGGVPVPAGTLILRGASGSKLEFLSETSPTVCPVGTSRCLAVRIDDGAAQSLTSAGVNLEKLTFFITPQADPFAYEESSGLYYADSQPTVTVALKAKTISAKPEDIVTLTAQTTVAARTYAR
jgi:prepilin-type N-terminal cleavage/methylation domain-containing protein